MVQPVPQVNEIGWQTVPLDWDWNPGLQVVQVLAFPSVHWRQFEMLQVGTQTFEFEAEKSNPAAQDAHWLVERQ